MDFIIENLFYKNTKKGTDNVVPKSIKELKNAT